LSQTIFVLEDDADISRLVQYHLESAGFTVRPYLAINQILTDAERQPPALFLLDIMVPGGDGLDLCRRLRLNPTLSIVPIIFLTARAAENDRVHGLEMGADDYITKPFATRELVARVKAVLRRFERPSSPSLLKFENVEIDAGAMQLRVNGELVTTTATEFRLLDYLARGESSAATICSTPSGATPVSSPRARSTSMSGVFARRSRKTPRRRVILRQCGAPVIALRFRRL
jgi:two-component system phosphate regulon response regulator PhoB